MACSNPVNGFPCGKCLNCRIQYSATWSARLLHELSTWNNVACFVTLTFRDEFLGKNELSIRELQLFIKRLRKSLGNHRIKHFSCGEYGDKSGRKHYHMIIFGLPCNSYTTELIDSLWQVGFIKVGTVTYDSCRYVADYVMKKYNGKKAYEEYGDKQPPFRLMSNGLGKSFVLSDIDNFIENQGFYIRGKFRGLPRYYKDVIYFDLIEKKGLIPALHFKRQLAVSQLKCSEKAAESLVRFARLHKCEAYNWIKMCSQVSEAHNNYKLNNFAKGGI